MDKEIPKEIKIKKRIRILLKYMIATIACVAGILILISFMRDRVNIRDISISVVDMGMIETSIFASGKVVLAFEEIINSPINSKIVDVYGKGGDSVDIGTPILNWIYNRRALITISYWTKS